MPPALSDVESGVSSDEEDIPFRNKGKAPTPKDSTPEAEEQDEDDLDDGEEEEEEYVVEKILTHRFRGAAVEYQVKWLGFEKKSDLTWEPTENLDGAKEIVIEYHKSIGGRPEPPTGKKRGRKSAADDSNSATPVVSSKRAKQKPEWTPPPGSWENDVDFVDTVEQGDEIDRETGEPVRNAYLTWKNGKKTQHPLKHVYLKCPQKMLQYYESHLVFTSQPPVNGDDL